MNLCLQVACSIYEIFCNKYLLLYFDFFLLYVTEEYDSTHFHSESYYTDLPSA